MVDLQQEGIAPTTVNMSSKKKELLSTAMKRTSEWIFSQEIPSDVTVHAGEVSFSLHKFPLVSKCGYIRKLVSESSDADLSVIEVHDVPGGAEAFELAAKFCYGINFEISTENIAMLRCVAEYLEMTEDYSVGNLVGRAEAYLNEVALKSLAGAVTILHLSEALLPMAEKVKVVSRCIDAIAYIACKESQFSMSGRVESGTDLLNSSLVSHPKHIVDWWAEDLIVLRIDIFQRVLIAMMARGFKQYALGPILMLYAQKSLRGLEVFGKGRKKIEPKQEHEKRVILETIVSLLPREKNAMSVSFLSMLLRAAIYLETTVACRLDLEKRMGLQLGQAVLDDLLIPSFSFTGDFLFDVDTVQRIMMNYLECETDGNPFSYNADEEYVSPPPSDLERVGKLMESYLAEIASDRNLNVSKFISLAELLPEQSRVKEDGMYRAIDIYLKKMGRFPLLAIAMWSLSLSVCVFPDTASAQLKQNYYANICPNVENIVRGVVNTKFKQTFVTVPATLRLFFHDCFVQGCDASVIISSTGSNTAEKDHPDNLSLAGDGFDTVIKAKAEVDKNPTCRNKVSCADILTMATRDVIALSGGPSYAVELGRLDGLSSTSASVNGKLPQPTFNLDKLNSLFAANGLSQTDMIALSAAHTLGFSHCSKFANRIYNFSRENPVDPTLDKTYAAQLQSMCPKNVDPRIAIDMDPTTPKKFDNVYYQNLQQGKGLFTSDEVLFTDSRSKPTVNTWASSSTAFQTAFVQAITKLGRVGVKTGKNGNIRRDCSVFN